MATDSSPGEKLDLSFTHPVPKPAGASPDKPSAAAAKREAANGGGAKGASSSAAKPASGKPVTAKRIKSTEPSSPVLEDTVAQSGASEGSAAEETGPEETAPEDTPQQANRAGVVAKTAGKPSKSKPADKASGGKKARRASAREELEELDKVGALSLMTLVPAWLISALVHMVILVVFGLMLMPEAKKEPEKNLMALATDKLEPLDEVAELQPEAPEIDTQLDVAVDLPPTPVATEDVMPTEIMDAEPPPADAPTFAALEIPATSATSLLSATSSSISGKGVSGRGAKMRADLAKLNGATGESEIAVARALKWLAQHQYADGSWSFDHTGGNCGGKCGNPGGLADARLAATGMALLPFLGAGNTHKLGKYKETVHAGLYYLTTHANLTKQGADFTGGGGAMYGQGIASIALCEAYAMSNDRELQQPAQLALNYIQYSQDPVGGGWNYTPRGAGDTSIAGWQIMALKSGMLNFLDVKEQTTKLAGKFLDSVQDDGGAFYGYRAPARGPATTAVGLLCRMYLGWKKDNPALEKGVRWLASQGPTTGNMYFSYYATQVVFQFDGKDGSMWKEWNAKMRDALVTSQSTKGHEEGSWMFPGAGDHGFDRGGRLYCTAMATMTLEVYYRYMPIYQEKNVDKDWEF